VVRAAGLKLDGFERMATELCGLVWVAVVLVGFVFERVVVRLHKGVTAGLGDLWMWATAVELNSDGLLQAEATLCELAFGQVVTGLRLRKLEA
jgi:hypothetical protein